MAKKMTKVRIHRDKKFLSLSTFTSVFMILISVILIGISSLDLAGVISFRYLDPNWLTNLDLEALLEHLPEGWNEMENTTLFEYETDYEGTLLFRSQNFGDYSKNWITGQWSWGNAPRYDTTGDEIVPQNFFPTKLQQQGRMMSKYITVTPKQNLGQIAMVPSNAFSVYHPNGDSQFDVDEVTYAFNFYPYDDVPEDVIDEPIQDETLRRLVATYSAFAKDHYTAIDDETRATLREYALANGLNENSPTLAKDIVRMVKEDNTYPVALDENGNPTLDEYTMKDCPAGMSPIVYFATDYHRGIWTHFAQAAVLFMRAFDIPARYVSGYRENVNDPENSIGIKEIWNWCEAWNDNAGWVPYDPGISLSLKVRPDQMTGGISGIIGKGQGEVPNDTPIALFHLISFDPNFSVEDPVYFRYASYGDYSRSLWGAAPVDEKAQTYPTPSLCWMGTSGRMMESAFLEPSVYIESTTTLAHALSPSYSVMMNEDEATAISYHDDHIGIEGEPQILEYNGVNMSVYAYSYPYFTRNVNPLQIKLRGYDVVSDSSYNDFWVRDNFLSYEDKENYQVGEAVRDFIRRKDLSVPEEWQYSNISNYYAAKDKFWDDLNSLVNSLADSVYYAAAMPDNVDPIVYLLDNSDEPKVANHTVLASAEVLILRALGIPARYVSGFVGMASPDSSMYGYSAPNSGVLNGGSAYAWCEAYEDGVGWRRLDPTSEIEVGGTPITAPGEIDDSGRYDAAPLVRNITTFYDGTVPDYVPDPITHSRAHPEIGEGDTVYFDPVADFVKKDVGTYIGLYTARVVDRNGNDVTHCYNIPKQYGTIRILKRPLIVVTPDLSGSISMDGYGEYNPLQSWGDFESMLMSPYAYYTNGEDAYNAYQNYLLHPPIDGAPFRLNLASGDYAVITSRASLTYQSTIDNIITVDFFDATGDGVTGNYSLDYYHYDIDQITGEGAYVNRPGRLTLTA